jgi:hypothetical protein
MHGNQESTPRRFFSVSGGGLSDLAGVNQTTLDAVRVQPKKQRRLGKPVEETFVLIGTFNG